ncbi:hypothetical protein B0H13DRAFT_2301302 [Mycena leptocephala]|nr:hypothetical protein B0H13DRAFT_2301302 [Mycena leptocephala]
MQRSEGSYVTVFSGNFATIASAPLVIPSICPPYGCGESLAAGKISEQLKQRFQERTRLLSSSEDQRREVEMIEADICAQIAFEQKRIHLFKAGRKAGWPLSVDFMCMVTQILTIETELYDLATDGFSLKYCPAWREFSSATDHKLHTFAQDGCENFEYAILHGRAGYFGPQGKQVIVDTICRIFTPYFAETRRRLSNTISAIISADPHAFESETRTVRPAEVLPLELFIEFVLVPHVATRLIATDMCVSLSDAGNIRADSADFGDMFHWNIQHVAVTSIEDHNKAEALYQIAQSTE